MLLISTTYPTVTWSSLGVVGVIVVICGLLYFRLVAPRLTEISYRNEDSKYNIRLIDRLVSLLLIFALFLTFVLISPPLHFPMVLLALLIFHRAVFNFAQGTTLIHELKLLEGQEIRCAQFKGVLQSLRWTGALVAEGDKLTFLSYSLLGRTGIQVVQQDVPTLVTIRCRWGETEDRRAHEVIENVFFDYPYIIDGTKPVWKYSDRSVDISLAMSNSKYVDSLCEVLDQKEIQAEVIT